MSLVIQTKKRSSLQNVVDKLSRDVAAQKLLEVVAKANEQVEEATILEQDLYVVPVPNLSCPPEEVVLSDPDPVLSDPVLSDPVLSDPVLSDPVLSDPVLSDPVLSDPVLSDPVLSDPVLSDPDLSDPDLSDPDLSDPVLSDPVLSDLVLSDPVSPSGSEQDAGYDEPGDSAEVEVINKEEKESRKSNSNTTVHRKRSSLGGFLSKTPDRGPKAPMRCDVCGLRVYKSYRYISRSSAPLHLKSFVVPSVDRFRVCKRCFSSRERCRQNLALILLKSKTSQMLHLRTPLGVTNTRATKGIEYIVRDLKDKLKPPYDDLMCNETLLDEDQMSNEEFSEKEERSSEPVLKVIVIEDGNFQPEIITTTPSSSNNIGVVTVVRPQSGVFSSTPNCFTSYGEMVDTKIDGEVLGYTKEAQGASLEVKMPDKSEEVKVKKTMNGGLSIEINSINNKLTLLDHAYALPPPKSKPAVTKPAKANDVKAPKGSPAKPAAQSVKKASDPSDDQAAPARTCGIVCTLCEKLVTKSYSCYNKVNAPDKVQHLFSDSVKVVKICRRCCPYKKPKLEDESYKVKPGKLVKVKAKKIAKTKPAKTAGGNDIKLGDSGKGKSIKNEDSPQGTKPGVPGSPVKNAQKDGKEDGRKGKETDKPRSSVVKVSNAGSQTDKTAAAKSSTKEMKVDKISPESKTSKSMQMTIKTRHIKKEECKVAEGKVDNQKSSTVKGSGQSPKSQVQIPDKAKTKEKSVSPSQEQESRVKGSERHKVDGNKHDKKTEAGTQSSRSLIGVKMKLKTNVASAEKDVQSSGEKVDSANLKAAESVKEEEEVIPESAVLEMQVDAPASEDSEETDTTGITKDKTATCKTQGKEGEEEEMEEEIEGQNEETKEETREEVKEKVEEKEKEAKKVQANETTAVNKTTESLCETSNTPEDKSEKSNAENYKEADTTKNETAEKLAECKPKDKGENKASEVSSPKRGRNVSTSERRKDNEKPVVPTVMTRKRLASLSETEIGEASKQADEPVTKRRVLSVIRDKVLKKNAGSDAATSQTSEMQAQQGRDSHNSSADSSEADDKASSQKSGQKNDKKNDEEETQDDSQGTNKHRIQAPIKCASCNHRVVKSYRCIQRDVSPNHIKPLFANDADEMLRICRRCLKPGQGKFKS